mmetsp:Transcript_32309/g.64888  ORF Transcript_32309/g.64888 Transcript_32309/m.64888 type:complete len:88 (-) Transcript_32309:66-329(-)
MIHGVDVVAASGWLAHTVTQHNNMTYHNKNIYFIFAKKNIAHETCDIQPVSKPDKPFFAGRPLTDLEPSWRTASMETTTTTRSTKKK